MLHLISALSAAGISDYVSPALSAASMIICIILLVLFLKSNKESNNENVSAALDSLNRKQDGLAQYVSGFESRIGEAINNASVLQNEALSLSAARQRDEFAALRRELSEAQASQRKELTEANERTLRTVQGRLDVIQKSNAESLEKIRSNVDEKLNETLTKRLNSSFETVNKQLESVYISLGEMKELSGGITNLNKVFSNIKSRGTWAEYQLEGILEQTIPGMFERNFKPDPAKGDVVEFAIRIPAQDGSTAFLPVDSKFPVEDYLRVVEAADNSDREALDAARKALSSSIILRAREIKKYIKEPVTTPFAIMYLATEGLYSEVIRSKDGVAERCQTEFNVMIAGPSTITALLSSLQVGFRAMKINEKAEEIRQTLAVAKAQYEKFSDALEKVKRNIRSAGDSLDEAVKRNGIIVKKLRNIEAVELSESEYLKLIESSGTDEQ